MCVFTSTFKLKLLVFQQKHVFKCLSPFNTGYCHETSTQAFDHDSNYINSGNKIYLAFNSEAFASKLPEILEKKILVTGIGQSQYFDFLRIQYGLSTDTGNRTHAYVQRRSPLCHTDDKQQMYYLEICVGSALQISILALLSTYKCLLAIVALKTFDN